MYTVLRPTCLQTLSGCARMSKPKKGIKRPKTVKPPTLHMPTLGKWATASWIKREGCNDKMNFDCAATDVCNLKAGFIEKIVLLRVTIKACRV